MDAHMPPSAEFDFYTRKIEPRLCPIEATGAAVLVNSIGSRATFRRGKIAKAILAAAGESVRQEIQAHVPLSAGQIVITSAGALAKTSATRYLFHTVVTSRETRYAASPRLVAQSTARAVQLADLLGQPSIAIPALGSGYGRGDPVEVVKQILNEVVAQLPGCRALQKVIFAATSAHAFELFHNRALAVLALAHSEQALKDSLACFPPGLYGLIGEVLQKLETARRAGDSQESEQLLQEAQGLRYLGEQLQARLPAAIAPAAKAVQLIIATGGSIVQNISQQTAGDHAVQVGAARDVTIWSGA